MQAILPPSDLSTLRGMTILMEFSYSLFFKGPNPVKTKELWTVHTISNAISEHLNSIPTADQCRWLTKH